MAIKHGGTKWPRWLTGWLLLSAAVQASVGPEAVATLGGSRTAAGAVAAGNAEGSIPAAGRCPSLNRDEAPLLLITGENAAANASLLGEGHRALLATLPESFALPVYATRRCAALPATFAEGSRVNALHAQLPDTAEAAPAPLVAGLPFPLLSGDAAIAGREAIWNHLLRWRGPGATRSLSQAAGSTRGELGLSRLVETVRNDALDTAEIERGAPLLQYRLRGLIGPARLAGTLKLIRQPLAALPMAWQRSPGQQRLERTGAVGQDTVLAGSEGLFDEDQIEGFWGTPARYDWKWLGLRELVVPYDSSRFEGAPADDIFGPRHVRPALARYERHRVQVVEARLKPAQIAAFARRVFYLDEDSWQVLLVDLYDRAGTLLRVQEVHTRVADDGALVPVLDAVYDLPGHRYFAATSTAADAPAEPGAAAVERFTPLAAESWARRHGVVAAERR